jgi:hypothetical protein
LRRWMTGGRRAGAGARRGRSPGSDRSRRSRWRGEQGRAAAAGGPGSLRSLPAPPPGGGRARRPPAMRRPGREAAGAARLPGRASPAWPAAPDSARRWLDLGRRCLDSEPPQGGEDLAAADGPRPRADGGVAWRRPSSGGRQAASARPALGTSSAELRQARRDRRGWPEPAASSSGHGGGSRI